MSDTILVFALCLCLAATLIHGSNESNERKPYIVYMGDVPDPEVSVTNVHLNLLSKAIGDEQIARESKIHSYGKSFNGFVANLLPHEAKKLSEEDGVVSVFENTRRKLHTTRSWDFLRMPTSWKLRNPKVESNIIVALMDTGIWVDSPSFGDKGFGPPPSKWKGKCDKGSNFTGCNKKVIGARYYNLDKSFPIEEDPTPADYMGHGTHTSSTAAGVSIHDASLYGIAKGTARGGVPSARIAMYKVCWSGGCTDMDILAGFDDAIHDGVDLISVSIGGPSRDFFEDPIAIGAFHAMKKRILTSCSAGNGGPDLFSVENVAPWVLTVGASSMDRDFRVDIQLGNGMKIAGNGINTYSTKKKMYPITSGTLAGNLTGNSTYYTGNSSACDHGTLSQDKVKGRIMYCLGNSGQDSTIKQLDGVGAIMSVTELLDVYYITLLPGSLVVVNDGNKIDRYINSTKNPKAMIDKSRSVNMTAPFVASFSARGPQMINHNILKPDVVAPGLNILAAYTTLTSLTGDPSDNRRPGYNIISGTSMSNPHAIAAAAYVKSFHPDWSPAAIKSALMTTATPMKIKDKTGKLGAGAGQINPVRAVHPGLIYDISFSSYIRFLCKEGYNSTALNKLIGDKKDHSCSSFKPVRGTDGLNYPSMHTRINSTQTKFSAIFYRTVTEVGTGSSSYKAIVRASKGLSIEVVPRTLNFSRLHEKKSFKVIVKGNSAKAGSWSRSGALVWSDGKHSVKSPILIYKFSEFI
ncbi:hypothetical protein SLE2022_079120 [Rubroshorea leprosula]